MPFSACRTFILVERERSSGRVLTCVGSRCATRTKAMPLPAGMREKNCSKASRPPAEAPRPTTGMGRLPDCFGAAPFGLLAAPGFRLFRFMGGSSLDLVGLVLEHPADHFRVPVRGLRFLAEI